jgi:hypothetical protein
MVNNFTGIYFRVKSPLLPEAGRVCPEAQRQPFASKRPLLEPSRVFLLQNIVDLHQDNSARMPGRLVLLQNILRE